ncbi:MAG TPA: hypothetical protein VN626_00415 [Clostridia bacterium]|nr:hypothetical protein [Clostridia bacterium]
MRFKNDAITRLMNRYRAQLPAQESFENKRKTMLEYIALYYDDNKEPQALVTRLHYLEKGRFIARSLLAALTGGTISCTTMMLCSGYLTPGSLLLGSAVYLLLTTVLAYAAYGTLMLVIRYFANADPYFTDEYEATRIRKILEEAVDEIAQMRLRL